MMEYFTTCVVLKEVFMQGISSAKGIITRAKAIKTEHALYPLPQAKCQTSIQGSIEVHTTFSTQQYMLVARGITSPAHIHTGFRHIGTWQTTGLQAVQ